jgi:hypothetical protein
MIMATPKPTPTPMPILVPLGMLLFWAEVVDWASDVAVEEVTDVGGVEIVDVLEVIEDDVDEEVVSSSVRLK